MGKLISPVWGNANNKDITNEVLRDEISETFTPGISQSEIPMDCTPDYMSHVPLSLMAEYMLQISAGYSKQLVIHDDPNDGGVCGILVNEAFDMRIFTAVCIGRECSACVSVGDHMGWDEKKELLEDMLSSLWDAAGLTEYYINLRDWIGAMLFGETTKYIALLTGPAVRDTQCYIGRDPGMPLLEDEDWVDIKDPQIFLGVYEVLGGGPVSNEWELIQKIAKEENVLQEAIRLIPV